MSLASQSHSTSVMDIATLEAFERKILWLAAHTIHNANQRPSSDGIKVGGHQASSASLVTIMTALYLRVLRPQDRVAVKPHASPVFHAIQYLLGNQTLDNLMRFRGEGGAQSYPSRTKDADDVDFSTGSVGLGVAVTAFASLVQDYLRAKHLGLHWPEGRMVSLLGDAELDEGNIFECLLESWKHGLKNCWWVIDYNRQSLDSVVSDQLFQKHAEVFASLGWAVVTMKYGRRLQAAFLEKGGEGLRQWIDECPNLLYSALTFQGGAAFRNQMRTDLADRPDTLSLIAGLSDAELHRLVTNLGGHDMDLIVEAFETAPTDRPVVFIAYTIKGHGLPFAGHKDNHAGLMTKDQWGKLRDEMGILDGQEWERFSGMQREAARLEAALGSVPFNARGRRRLEAKTIPVESLPLPEIRGQMSTQQGFGLLLQGIARAGGPLADRIVTTSPDVTVSTNLGPWVNQRGLFARSTKEDVFAARKLMSPQKWEAGPRGQHMELGIAENNLFLMLAAMGLSHTLFGERLIPIGTLYDPFISRGLDALNYACYQDARFILVATPSGVTLAPEGGAHQSIATPLIGMSQDGLASFEPAYVDELAAILEWAFAYIQRGGKARAKEWVHEREGGSVYLRLTTRPLDQLIRPIDEAFRKRVVDGGYWMRAPREGARLAIVYQGAIAPEAATAMGRLLPHEPGAGLLAVTSADRLEAGWRAGQASDAGSLVEELLAPLARDATIVTVIDGHPATLSWLGGVHGHRVIALGVDQFGQTGTIQDAYRLHGIDAETIERAGLSGLRRRR
jgi:pyruvate dehydrogenase E1 component